MKRKSWVSLSMKKLQYIVPLLLFFTIWIPVSAQDGEALFKANCAACHKPTSQKLVGPGLAGVEERWESKDALHAWIKDSQGYLKSTDDAYAKAMFEEYNKAIMPPQPVSDEEIDAILAYVANAGAGGVQGQGTASSDGRGATEGEPGEVTDGGNVIMWLLLIVVVLFITVRVLSGVTQSLENLNRQKEGLEPVQECDMFQKTGDFLKRNKVVSALIIILILGYGSVLAWDFMMGIGVYKGYAPAQPIWFSHKVHAGQNGISCQYCHNSAEKGKTAGIPTVNVCMNCHMGVQSGKITGTTEISKIYDAIGWDPDQLAYIEGYEQKPIEWVRVHNLQDFVYFNHSQHVVVGKQECQTCHGPVEEMDVMYQYSDLTMGWCVNCHRETNVSMKDNEYYDRIHADLVEKYKEEGIETFTVEQIGGLECAKCHY